MLPVRFSDQILPGTFEYAVKWLVDHEIDLSVFDARYRNDQTGATAYHPSVLLKVVLLGYARGLVSSSVEFPGFSGHGIDGGVCSQTEDLDWYARELARLPFAFEVLQPPALKEALARLGQRLLERGSTRKSRSP